MRQSSYFAPTLRQAKTDNEGHALLLRGGYLRQLASGIYSYLPLGYRVLRNVERIVREEMNGAGAIELHMPALHPVEIWQESGRDKMDILFRLEDSRGSQLLLGPTHEEIVTDIVRSGISSYKQLPITLYQIQTKFRDEPRPRAGLLRGREFVMKDAYSFDADIQSLDESFSKMLAAYQRIFSRCGLEAQIVDASGGGIGGFDTKEFMVASPVGEDIMLFCPEDGYAANLELATSALEPVANRDDISGEREQFATPGINTIEALAAFPGGAAPQHQVKTLVYNSEGQFVILLLRGDHQLNDAKLLSLLHGKAVRPATPEEIFALLGAHPGSLGAVGLEGITIIADEALRGRTHMTTGANQDGYHWRGVSMDRDIRVGAWQDLREARAGEMSPRGGGALQEAKCIEVGHIFKLGNKYSQAMNATFLDQNGKAQIMEMGCYGIGVSRIIAAVAQSHRDERGLLWPRNLAPFQVHLLNLERDETVTSMAEAIYQELCDAKVEVIYDDRNERPGSKFADADLVGAPLQIVVGKTTRETGEVELRTRWDKASELVPAGTAVERTLELLGN